MAKRKDAGAKASVSFEDEEGLSGGDPDAKQQEVNRQVEQQKEEVQQQPPVSPSQSFIDFHVEVPTMQVPLPSKGKVYLPDHPLHNAEIVELRHMTGKDEDTLTTRALIRRGTVVDKLLKDCIIDKRVNVKDLLIGDRNALMVSLRITGRTAEYSVNVTHPVSGEEFEHTFNLDGLEIKELGEEPVAPGENRFEYVLPLTKIKLFFKLLTSADEEVVNQQVEAKRKQNLGSGSDALVTSRIKQQIIEMIDTQGNTTEDRNVISNFVENMPSVDLQSFRDHVDEIEPDVDMRQEVVCPVTGEVATVDIPITVEFFWPSARK